MTNIDNLNGHFYNTCKTMLFLLFYDMYIFHILWRNMDTKHLQLFSTLVVNKQSEQPLYMQLVAFIKDNIENGTIIEGYLFPSFRSLAEYFNVSRMSVAECFDTLLAEGYVAQNKSKRYVASREFSKNRNINWKHFISRANHANSDRNSVLSSGDFYIINSDEFGFRNMYADAIKKVADSTSFIYAGHESGFYELREQIALFLKQRDIHVKPSQILVTQNEHVGLYVICVGLLNSNSTIVTTRPSRFLSFSALQVIGTPTIYLKTDDEGPIISDLYSKLKHAINPTVCLEPNYAYATNNHMSNARKKEIYELCSHLSVPLIEIDNLRDYIHNYNSAPIKSLDTSNSSIYLSNLGQALNYHNSIGFIVGDEAIINHFTNIYREVGHQCSNLTQAIYLELLKSGAYEQCINELKPKIHQRCIQASNMFERYLSKYASFDSSMVNTSVPITFNHPISVVRMNIKPGKCSWIYNAKIKNSIRIMIASCSIQELEQFIAILAKECEKQLENKTNSLKETD